MKSHIFTRAFAAALATLLLAGCGANGTLQLPTGVVYPSITPVDGSPDLTVTHPFTFEGSPRSVSLVIDGGVFAGAQQAEKSVIRFGKSRENDWIEDYYPAFVFEDQQDGFFSALIEQFRSIKVREGLDSDRYVELMTAYVQSLEYRIDPVDLSPKFPVETAGELAGDCDDKALLLGGLLAREGYDVAILLFGPEQHVALGIRADAMRYGDTGYAFIETTTGGFVGMPPDTIGEGTTLESKPQVFRLGDGSGSYGAGAQVARILETAEAAESEAEKSEERLRSADTGLKTLEAETRSLKTRLDALAAAGDTAGYNALVPAYNASAEKYNAAVASRNALAEKHNAIVALHTYIVRHLDDRSGVYDYVMANPL